MTWKLSGNVVPGMGSNWNYLCLIGNKRPTGYIDRDFILWGIEAVVSKGSGTGVLKQ